MLRNIILSIKWGVRSIYLLSINPGWEWIIVRAENAARRVWGIGRVERILLQAYSDACGCRLISLCYC